MIFCRARLVTMEETWLCHYDPKTKQQSMEWRHSGSPSPKIPNAKIRWKSSRLEFLGSRWHPPHWLSSKGPNYQRGVLLNSAGANEWHFEGKTPREGHQGFLVLARQCPSSPGTCNPEETGLLGLPVSWSPTLFSRSGPFRLYLFPGLKKNSKFAIFCPTRRRPGWTDSLLNFFLSGLRKLEQQVKKCIEFCGEYVE